MSCWSSGSSRPEALSIMTNIPYMNSSRLSGVAISHLERMVESLIVFQLSTSFTARLWFSSINITFSSEIPWAYRYSMNQHKSCSCSWQTYHKSGKRIPITSEPWSLKAGLPDPLDREARLDLFLKGLKRQHPITKDPQ